MKNSVAATLAVLREMHRQGEQPKREPAADIRHSLKRTDPAGRLVSYCVPGGTDAKTYASPGTKCFGFTPLLLPPELDFLSLFHGVGKRIPISSLAFSVHVMYEVLTAHCPGEDTP